MRLGLLATNQPWRDHTITASQPLVAATKELAMRKHLSWPVALLALAVLVSTMLVGAPRRADAAIIYYGIAESSRTHYAAGSAYTFLWRFSVGRDTGNNTVHYRAHFWCTRNGADTRCNFGNDAAFLYWKDCEPSDFTACPNGAWGPRNFPRCPTYCNVVHAYYNGTPHSDSRISYRSVTGILKARFLEIDVLLTEYNACSKWTDVGGPYADYAASSCGWGP
jgi:hypothetical protein